jgi:serine protease Do
MRKLAFLPVAALALASGFFAFGSSGGAPSDSNIFVSLSKKIVPSVVNISSMSTVKSPYTQGNPNDSFRKFFEEFLRRQGGGGGGEEDEDGQEQAPPPPQHSGPAPRAMSLGTGFIIDSSGLILTNNHVVAEADEIKIVFTEDPDETPTDGEVVGRDAELDVALIRVKTKRTLSAVALGDSDALEVGEYVIAVGNPFGQGHSVTHGIISAKGRLMSDFPLANYLQTDAPINPGNSGGPLVNLKGEVIGINNAIDQRAQGIGFAIPINFVKKILPQLRANGSVARGYIGVLVGELSPELSSKLKVPADVHAPFVTHVFPGQPADQAGIRPYDVILDIGGKAVHSSPALINAVTQVSVGDTVPVKVLREGKELTFSIKISQRPGTPHDQQDNPKHKKKDKKPTHLESGMQLEELTPEIRRDLTLGDKTHGVVVSSISYGGPADKAGLERGDLILEVDRKPVKDVDGFYSLVKEKKSYLLRVRRVDPHGEESFAVIILDLKE